MTVYLPKGGKSWYYDYRYKGQRFRGPTQQLNRADAALVEAQIKLQQRREAGGIAAFEVGATPRFQQWADVYLRYQKKYIDRPDLVASGISAVLEFWGAKPKKPKRRPTGTNARRTPPPYHDLRLGHPIADPSWITKFEKWIEQKGVSGSTRNTYLSILSGMYRVALQPEYRKVARIPDNPFLAIRRSGKRSRLVALPMDQVKAWMAFAPPHVRVAMAIASLAPKMRLKTILNLQFGVHINADLTQIVVYEHKTRKANEGRPQVTPVGSSPEIVARGDAERSQLQDILDAIRGNAKTGYVITYHGEPVRSIKTATMRAAKAAGLTWGASVNDGVTFHTIRHSIATFLAELGIGERLRMELMGHSEMRTTQQYTHLAAASQVQPHAQLSDALAIKDIVLGPHVPRRRGKNKPAKAALRVVGSRLGTPSKNVQKRPGKHAERKRHLRA